VWEQEKARIRAFSFAFFAILIRRAFALFLGFALQARNREKMRRHSSLYLHKDSYPMKKSLEL
jgi:hypothetical protein